MNVIYRYRVKSLNGLLNKQVIIDVEQGHGFDDVCLATIKRVEAALAQRQGEGS